MASQATDKTKDTQGAGGEKPRDPAKDPKSSAPSPSPSPGQQPQQSPSPSSAAQSRDGVPKDTIAGDRKNRANASSDQTKHSNAPSSQDTANSLLKNPIGGLSESGNKDAPEKKKEGSLRIHIDLDLHVEVHLEARVKGEITIGLL